MTEKKSRGPEGDPATNRAFINNTEIRAISQDYLQSGLSVIPAYPGTKKPTIEWKDYQTVSMTLDAAKKLSWPGIAAITGYGSLEILDFDYKAKWFEPWEALVEAEAPGLVNRLLIEKSQSDGKHAVYRCHAAEIPGNTKLAYNKIEVNGPGEHEHGGKKHTAVREGDKWSIYPCYIETRGTGGYALIAPTKGYIVENSDFFNIPEITPAERDLIIKCAKALNRYVKPTYHKQPDINGDRPGDIYNEKSDVRTLLEKHGWTAAGSRGDFEHWTRPGKERGISASLIDGKLFHVFTTNGAPLEGDRVYTPFQLYAEFEHSGDFEAAAKALWQEGYRGEKVAAAPDEPPEEKKSWTFARGLLPRIPYPWDILPEDISNSLQKLARACASTAAPLPGFACAMIGAAVGRKVAVSLKSSWYEPLVFWPFDIHDSGEGKTAKMQNLARVFTHIQRETQKKYCKELADWEAKKARKEKDCGLPPARPRGYYITDLTLEGLRAELEEHPTGGIIAMLSEASSFISSQNEYKQKGTDRESWLKLHDGHDARIIRATKSMLITGARVQVIGGVQPAIFKRVFGGDGGQYLSDGTIHRGLYTYSPPEHHPLTLESWGKDDREPWESTLKMALQWADAQLLQHVIRLNREAQEVFLEWRNTFDETKNDLPPVIRQFLPKSYGYALRFAGAISLMHSFFNGYSPKNFLNEEDMTRGIKAVFFHLGQVVDAMLLILGKEITIDPIKTKILEAFQERQTMTATEIYRDVFKNNKPAKKIQQSLDELVDKNQISATTEPTNGKSKTTYTLNVKNVFTYKAQPRGFGEKLNTYPYVKSPPGAYKDFEGQTQIRQIRSSTYKGTDEKQPPDPFYVNTSNTYQNVKIISDDEVEI